MKIAIFFGSTMGATEEVAEKIASTLGCDFFNIEDSTKEQLESYDFLILGSSTWGAGDLQGDWINFFEDNPKLDLKGKTIAIFGLGDQEDHYDYFVNAIGILYDIAINSGAKVIGQYPKDGYRYGNNTSAVRNDVFVGLPLDEVNQANLTDKRVEQWLKSLF